MSNEDQPMITTITNSDPGRHVRTWGPFSYYEGFNSVDIIRDSGEDTGGFRASMTGHGFIEIATESGRKLCIDDTGEVTVWRMHTDGEICISSLDAVDMDFPHDGSSVSVGPDGWVDQDLGEMDSVDLGESDESHEDSAEVAPTTSLDEFDKTDPFTHVQAFRLWQDRPGLPKALAELKDLATLSEAVNALIDVSVQQARVSGHSWEKVGEQLGVSKQAAAKRFGAKTPKRS